MSISTQQLNTMMTEINLNDDKPTTSGTNEGIYSNAMNFMQYREQFHRDLTMEDISKLTKKDETLFETHKYSKKLDRRC